MATRKVVVASPASNQAKVYTTSAAAWGELQNEISDMYNSGYEAILWPGNLTLNRADAALPDGDFRVYLNVRKNASGAINFSEAQALSREIGEAIVTAANKVSQEDVDNLKKQLIQTVEDFFGVSIAPPCPECDEALADAKRYFNQ